MCLHYQKKITLPLWLQNMPLKTQYTTDEAKANLAIELASLNVKHETGGPFGAAIFNDATGKLISVGVNLVVHSSCSVNHAEITAIMLGQEKLGEYRLNANPEQSFVLATSAQPCSMCFGAILWSGLSRVIISASRDDVMTLTGFDEGPLPSNWIQECETRGIQVTTDVLREKASAVLKRYHQQQGTLY